MVRAARALLWNPLQLNLGVRQQHGSVMNRLFAITSVLLAATACDKPITVCGGLGAPDVAVTVVDSLTGAPIAAGAVLLTFDLDAARAPVDSVVGQSDTDPIFGAIDR